MQIVEVYRLARRQRLSHSEAVIATAIAVGESGLNPNAVGDTSLTTAVWGPSIGLWQVRSLKAEAGTGHSRDATRLKNPAFNARSMALISNFGTNWSPWSVFTSGAYRKHIDAVEAAVKAGGGAGAAGAGGGVIAGGQGTGVPASSTMYPDLADDGLDNGSAAGGVGPVGSSGAAGGIGGVGDAIGLPGIPGLDDVGEALVKGLIVAAGVGLGVTLVAIGAWRAVSGTVAGASS